MLALSIVPQWLRLRAHLDLTRATAAAKSLALGLGL
jgi:hypothetical protein